MTLADVIAVILDCADPVYSTNEISTEAKLKALRLGWDARTEYPAPYLGRKGRIDLLLSYGSTMVGIEVDNVSVKKKSIEKLKLLDITYRVVVVAYGDLPEIPDGMDAVVSLKSKDFKIRRL